MMRGIPFEQENPRKKEIKGAEKRKRETYRFD